MITINRTIGILILSAIVATSGCSNFTTRPLPVVTGTDTSGVTLLINNEDGSAILTGQVRKAIDAKIIESTVREQYGISKINNQLSHD